MRLSSQAHFFMLCERIAAVKRVLLQALVGLVLGGLAFVAQAVPVLVDTAWVAQHATDPDMVLVDMSADQGPFKGKVIPGAVKLPYSALVQKDRSGVTLRVSNERLYEVLGILGIDASKHVVAYDDMGGLHAGRLFWELERIGHPRASILDGGIAEWVRQGLKFERTPEVPLRAVYQPNGQGRDNEADLQTVREALGNGSAVLLDVRSQDEYKGVPGRGRSGHIPGARWWPWEQVLQMDKGLTEMDVARVDASLQQVGASKDKLIIAYCRSGHRASRTYATLRRLGFEQVKLYDGSMSEWEKQADAPVKAGMEP
jgi:thiosulfate/3-mercaptopyruvate sulfurtransferase